jgi:HEAT repeat protein
MAGLTCAQTVSRRDLRKWTGLLRSDDPQERSSAATNLLSTTDPSALEVLIKTLDKDVPEAQRISVITAFGIKGDDRACSEIIAALNDPSEAVRQAAMIALQGVSTPNAIQKLQKAARDSNQALLVRTQAIGILGEMRVIDAIPALIELLSDPNESVRAATRTALERITLRSFSTSREWSAWWEPNSKLSREEILEDLVNFQYDRIRHLNEIVERLYLLVLSERKDKTDPAPLIAAFNEIESSKVKLYAIRELAAIEGQKPPEVIATLIRAMSDPDAAVRSGSAQALGTSGDPAASDALIAALEDPASQVKAAAAKSLGTLKMKRAAPLLCGLLADSSDDVAIAAANALGEIADPVALDVLIRIVKSDGVTPGLYEASANALAKMKDPRAIPGLIGLLKSDKDKLRWSAVDALGNLRASDAVEPLKNLAINDANPQIREAALAALNKIGDVSAWETMLQALYDKDKRVAEQAKRSLLLLAGVDSSVYGLAIDRLLADGKYELADAILTGALEPYAKTNNNGEATALRKRMAQGLLAAREWGRARPHLEAIVAKSPKDQSALKDLAMCLAGMADYDTLLALYAQARKTLPADSLYWWQETARTLEQMLAGGDPAKVIAAAAALEKEDANLGGPAVAPRIQETLRKARAMPTAEKTGPPAATTADVPPERAAP